LTAAAARVLAPAFTAGAMQGGLQRFRAAGCDGYLAKPIDAHSVAASVEAYLGA